MMARKDTLLGNILDVRHGYAFKSEFFTHEPSPHVLLTPGNFLDEGGFKWASKQKFYDGPIDQRFVLNKGDLLVAMTEQAEGLLGSCLRVPGEERFLHNQRLGKIYCTEHLDTGFAYYLLNWSGVRNQVRATSSGTKVRHTSPDRIKDVEVPLPPLPIQRRLTEILSAFDDLILVNTRCIRVLEEMARRTYLEWFVYYRFPGGEGKRPEDWREITVEEAFEITGGGTPSRKRSDYWEGGTINWYSPTDLTKSGLTFLGRSNDQINELGLKKSSAHMFAANSVMLTSRATIGAVAINTTKACTNQGFITCLPNERVPVFFLFQWVKANVPEFIRHASGSTFKEISKSVFRGLAFEMPTTNLVERYEQFAAPLMRKIQTLEALNSNLRAQRDLLLPLLVSGAIDVSDAKAVQLELPGVAAE